MRRTSRSLRPFGVIVLFLPAFLAGAGTSRMDGVSRSESPIASDGPEGGHGWGRDLDD